MVGVTGMKFTRHNGIEEDILKCLNRPSSTYRILLMIKELNKYDSITHATILKYLNELHSEGKINKADISSYGKNRLIIWSKNEINR
jgi:predicted aldo/keto reductase-like oxidoreductase